MFDLEDELINDREESDAPIDYYTKLMQPSKPEEQHLDLSQPLGFYGSHMKLAFSERVNLLEREAVKFY